MLLSGSARESWTPDWPELQYAPIPLGKAKTVREGKDAVVITYSRHVQLAVEAANEISQEGRGEVGVIDFASRCTPMTGKLFLRPSKIRVARYSSLTKTPRSLILVNTF